MAAVPAERIESRIFMLRGHKVMLSPEAFDGLARFECRARDQSGTAHHCHEPFGACCRTTACDDLLKVGQY